MAETTPWAGQQTISLDLICILSSQLPDRLPLETDPQAREQGAIRQHHADSLDQAETARPGDGQWQGRDHVMD